MATATIDGCTASAKFPKLAALIQYLDSLHARADLDLLSKLLLDLDATRADFEAACLFNPRGYKRNTICNSGWYELLANCWRSGDCTPIHDHRGVSCAFKVIEGVGTEIRFSVTPSGLVCPTRTLTMKPGYVCSADEPDIHQVANMQPPGTDLVTLHIYSPPITRMNTYEFARPCMAHDEAAVYRKC